MANLAAVAAVATVITVGTLAAIPSCYRPHLVDCVLGCTGGCPDGMTCEGGLCTRGAICTTDVAAGGRHTCAIQAGDVTCWGSNSHGQLGVAGGGNRGGAAAAPSRVVLGQGRTATSISAGGRHTCAVVDDGQGPAVACWGDDSFGQLGGSAGPAGAVAFEAGRTVVSVTAGLYHTCALLDDGSVRCWGDDRLGQRGLPHAAAPSVASDTGADAQASAQPDASGSTGVVPGSGTGAGELPPVNLGGLRARAVSAGAYHTCAVLDDGGLRCWGWNDYGQLGDGSSPSGDVAPGLIVTVDLGGGRRAERVAAGAFHTCVISDEEQTICWGQNSAGQIGTRYDPAQRTMAPGTPVDLGRGRHALRLAAGASHTCAMLDDFTTKCWGFNGDGELGVSGTQNLGDDEALGDALPRVTIGQDAVVKISAGANHTCVVQAADVKCWGFGGAGRLGTSDDKNRGDSPAHSIVPAQFRSPSP